MTVPSWMGWFQRSLEEDVVPGRWGSLAGVFATVWYEVES